MNFSAMGEMIMNRRIWGVYLFINDELTTEELE